MLRAERKHNQRIVLEHDFAGEYTEVFIDMFREYPEIALVVDTARLDISGRVLPGFDPYAWLDALAPYVYLVHLCVTRRRISRIICRSCLSRMATAATETPMRIWKRWQAAILRSM